MRTSASSYVSLRRQVQKQQFVIDLIDPWYSSSHEVLLESRIVSGLLKDFCSLFEYRGSLDISLHQQKLVQYALTLGNVIHPRRTLVIFTTFFGLLFLCTCSLNKLHFNLTSLCVGVSSFVYYLIIDRQMRV